MEIYTYKFNDGSLSEVKVSNELYKILIEMDNQEKNNNKTETRRHVSFNYLNSFGIDVEAQDSNPLLILIKRAEKKKLNDEMKKALSELSQKQRKLLSDVYGANNLMAEIAKKEGVKDSAIRQRMFRVITRLRNILLK